MFKVKREVMVLKQLQGGPNIIKLLDVVRDEHTRTPSLVFEHVANVHYEKLYPQFTDMDIRYYVYELLKALDFAHSKGVIHRDVKPGNIVIDHPKRKLRLIDWGLCDFYFQGKPYNCRVASLYYKGPELLVGYQTYDYSLDVWSTGCVLACMIFNAEPFFWGDDNIDQLAKIAEVLGTADLRAWLKRYKIKLSEQLEDVLSDWPQKPLTDFIADSNRHLVSPEALDLISRMLRYDHMERITTQEAMLHPFFEPIRRAEQQAATHSQ
eukprot:TRINITY_DN5336_c0_g1_i2.p1 TRINITY_DN5336_c0_g1~~TRINITY_DN5336_c0_g1_i2.p1  ORF type:complete len:266 (+),score=45.28 TRINITY_DN5336_c0_g1_i2:262-1059(+)